MPWSPTCTTKSCGAALVLRRSRRARSHLVGAVYDFRNDIAPRSGKVNIVNVNGHTDPAKIASFLRAVDDRPAESGATMAPPASPSPSIAH